MIFTKDLLFIHVPRTGGSSVSLWLLDVLPKPIWCTHPEHEREDSSSSGLHQVYEGAHAGEDSSSSGISWIHGRAHENLTDASGALPAHGIDIQRLPLILAGIRNPYALEVSRYFHFRTTLLQSENPGRKLAREADFESFVVNCKPEWVIGGRLEPYFLLDGELPENLVIVRAESAHEELVAALARIGVVANKPLPWHNKSEHDHFLTYYTPAAEEAVYRRHQWVFERGLYARLDLGRLKSS